MSLAGGKTHKTHKMTVGSRRQVMNGTAKKTAGGLKRGDLKYVGDRIRSRKACAAAQHRFSKMMRDPVFRRKWDAQKIKKKTSKRKSRRKSKNRCSEPFYLKGHQSRLVDPVRSRSRKASI